MARHAIGVERPDEVGEGLEAGRVGVDEGAVDRTPFDQQAGQAVEEDEVRLRLHGQVERGGHRRLGPARVDDEDLGPVRVPRHALPEHRVGDAGIGPD